MELKTVEKACRVFRCFTQGHSPISATELSDKLKMSNSTISRLLLTLKSQGFLERDASSRRYRLGPVAAEMARAVRRYFDCQETTVAIPHVNALRDKIGETIVLEILARNTFYHAYVADSLNPVCLRVLSGEKVMPHANGGAKAVVAFSEADLIDYWLNQKLPLYTKNTIVNSKQLRKMYSEIRKTGIAYDNGEYVEEVHAVGAPIFNHEDKPIAGITIMAVSNQERKEWDQRYLFHLKETVNEISCRLHSSKRIE